MNDDELDKLLWAIWNWLYEIEIFVKWQHERVDLTTARFYRLVDRCDIWNKTVGSLDVRM